MEAGEEGREIVEDLDDDSGESVKVRNSESEKV